jgi:tetratricopeptide (TPR) repeat protein
VLGNYYIGIQQYPNGIEQYEECTKIAPDYSPAYNSLGYAYRAIDKYDAAEEAFKRYTELIPDDPNPPDSYAELLMKMGRFQESIVEYRKALSIDPNFINSRMGVAANLTYLGRSDEADAELQKLYDMARNDGERRTALFSMVVLDVDGGKMDEALAEADKEYAIAEKANDMANMSADLVMKGNILREMGNYDDALTTFNRSLETMERSSLSQPVKDLAKLGHHFNVATVAVMKKDLKTARSEAAQFQKGAQALKNNFQVRRAHELAGMIALEERDFEKAISELKQANQLDPYNLYRLSLAYDGKKDSEKAKEFCTKAAKNNTLPALNYAFVRSRATRRLSTL